jgi:hypothetical protein
MCPLSMAPEPNARSKAMRARTAVVRRASSAVVALTHCEPGKTRESAVQCFTDRNHCERRGDDR